MKAALKALAALPDVSDADKAAAKACLERSKRADMKTWFYNLSAPIVMLAVLPFVKREANQLPNFFRNWDNNISMNGDSGGVQLPDGSWVGFNDVKTRVAGGWEAVIDCLQVSYGDPRYGGDAYYAPGHHPRSFWARYIWLGWRNRASQLSIEVGVEVKKPVQLLSGNYDISTKQEGHFLLKSGDNFHFKTVEKVKLFGRNFARIRSVGFKLDIARNTPGQSERAAAVYIPWSLKAWKDGAA